MQPEFNRMIDVADIGSGGIVRDVVADADERAALAERFDLVALDSLSAQARITPCGRRNFRLRVTFMADVLQSCVVTLEPVASRISDAFELVFAPADHGKDVAKDASREVDIDPYAEDPPELLEGDCIDIGEYVAEYLALALDPYPREVDAEVAADMPVETDDEDRRSPFGGLAALKQKMRADG